MARPRKDGLYLNVYLSRDTREKFDEFCKKVGQTKSTACERALEDYMAKMTRKMRKAGADV